MFGGGKCCGGWKGWSEWVDSPHTKLTAIALTDGSDLLKLPPEYIHCTHIHSGEGCNVDEVMKKIQPTKQGMGWKMIKWLYGVCAVLCQVV